MWTLQLPAEYSAILDTCVEGEDFSDIGDHVVVTWVPSIQYLHLLTTSNTVAGHDICVWLWRNKTASCNRGEGLASSHHVGGTAEPHGNPSSCVSLYVEVEETGVSLVPLNSHIHCAVTDITVIGALEE